MGNLITRAQAREANDVRYATVPVPEWGEGPLAEEAELRLRSMTAKGLITFTNLKGEHEKQGIVRGLIMSACDEQGELIFANEDIPWLLAKNVAVLRRVQQAIMELNGLNDKNKTPLEDAGKD